MPTPKKISDIKPLFTNLAQTSHFLVQFGISQNRELVSYLQSRGVDSKFIVESSGLLVRDAVIPTTSFVTMQAIDYIGVIEKFAHTRQFTDMQMEIYVDKEYKTIKFFEHWMEFIASGGHNQSLTETAERKPEIALSRKNYVTRYQYPKYYKSDSTKMTKFERDYKNELEYNFLGLFPSSMNSISVSYQSSDIMTLGVTFSYDRYIPGKVTSLAESQNQDNNKNKFLVLDKSVWDQVVNMDADQLAKLYRNDSTIDFDVSTKINYTSSSDFTKLLENTKLTNAFESKFELF